MIAGILKECDQEKRVAILPQEAAQLGRLGMEVIVESGAGEGAFAKDEEYVKAGARIMPRNDVIDKAGLLITVNLISGKDLQLCSEGKALCSVLNPAGNFKSLEVARAKGLSVLGLDLIPRITRAQSMDVLSSMATVAGYKAVLDAASMLPRFFPMFMTAAGTIKPARVLILGAGVAGLQALSIARKLGAVVEVFDVRSAVKEEVKSLGGRFIEVEGSREDERAGGYAVEQTEEYQKKQADLIHKHAISSDVVIATAQIPGRKAPVLIGKETVLSMKPGTVIIDLAASTGGNCELTRDGETVLVNGVRIAGKSDYPGEMSSDASKLFGNNIINLLKIMTNSDGSLSFNFQDEIIRETTAVHKYEYVSDRIKQMLNLIKS
ncbi:MAG: Re/Si-specific NAD(P)(+) transhydrogenase subunit alpha [Bacteroidales bacterium]|jgi:NAD(P) transhydrogenase subunit alpha|nr:Re/Si-specific NAD(P)(+) transhydrogenase subunit alpha [Bacteroidales bacterium]